MIGLIVSSMPSLPAFVNHLRGRTPSTSVSFVDTTNSSSLHKDSKTQAFRFTRSSKRNRGAGSDDHDDDPPFLHHVADSGGYGNAGYEELTELEGQQKPGLQTKREKLEGLMGIQ